MLSRRLIELKITTGMLPAKNPYTTQSTRPKARVANIFLDTASVSPSRQHFKSCGTKLQLERQPAIRPIIVGSEIESVSILPASANSRVTQLQCEDGCTEQERQCVEDHDRHALNHHPVHDPQGVSRR